LGKFLITFLFLLIAIRGVRIYSRTALKGELIIAASGFILLLSYYAHDAILGWIAFAIFNAGLLILYSFEINTVRQIYRQLTIYKRIIGDYPQILDENESRKANTVVVIINVSLCFLTAFEFYRIKINNIGGLIDKHVLGLVAIGILILAGILFLVYYFIKKVVK